jgi:hypothetical protein
LAVHGRKYLIYGSPTDQPSRLPIFASDIP